MNIRCTYQSFEGLLCKRWAMRGSHFCFNHQPPPDPNYCHDGASLHPLARLANPEDIFDVLRETLNAARHGRIAPRQAYAVGYLAQILLKVYDRACIYQRDEALNRQIIPTLADEETAAEAAKSLLLPLPVQIDDAADTSAPLLPHNSAPPAAQPPGREFVAEIKRLAAVLAARSGNGKPPGKTNGAPTEPVAIPSSP